jgi:predicted phosphodiesterase
MSIINVVLDDNLSISDIQQAVNNCGSIDNAAKLLGIKRQLLRNFCHENKISYKKEINNVSACETIYTTSKVSTKTNDRIPGKQAPTALQSILIKNNQDPEQWEVTSVKVSIKDIIDNEGDFHNIQNTVFQAQKKFLPDRAFRGRPIVIKSATKKASKNKNNSKLHVIASDMHFGPFQDKTAIALFTEYLRLNQPDCLHYAGDLPDLSAASTYDPKDDRYLASINTCIQETGQHLAKTRALLPDTEINWIPGNHDKRMKDMITRLSPALNGLKRAGDQLDVLSLRYLLRLDELGIKEIDDLYPEAEIEILPQKLYVVHGEYTGPSASKKHIERRNYDVIFGHTHTIAMFSDTIQLGGGTHITKHSYNIGHMSLQDGHGYAKNPSWQQGFGIVRTWDDNTYSFTQARIFDGHLYAGDQRISYQDIN